MEFAARSATSAANSTKPKVFARHAIRDTLLSTVLANALPKTMVVLAGRATLVCNALPAGSLTLREYARQSVTTVPLGTAVETASLAMEVSFFQLEHAMSIQLLLMVQLILSAAAGRVLPAWLAQIGPISTKTASVFQSILNAKHGIHLMAHASPAMLDTLFPVDLAFNQLWLLLLIPAVPTGTITQKSVFNALNVSSSTASNVKLLMISVLLGTTRMVTALAAILDMTSVMELAVFPWLILIPRM